MNRCFATALVVMAVGATARAQVINPQRSGDRHHLVHVGFGLDGPMRIELGYTHTGEVQPVGPLATGVRLSMPLMPDLGDLELSGLVQGGLVSASGWGFSPRLELAVRTASTAVAGVTDLGVRANLTAGYFGERAMVVAEGSWERALVAHIRPSDRYREAYPDARAGLYAGGGGFFRLGLAASVRLFTGSELTLRTGMTRSDQGRPVDLLPFYAQLGFNQGF